MPNCLYLDDGAQYGVMSGGPAGFVVVKVERQPPSIIITPVSEVPVTDLTDALDRAASLNG
jgi:hypothetical protein